MNFYNYILDNITAIASEQEGKDGFTMTVKEFQTRDMTSLPSSDTYFLAERIRGRIAENN